MAEGLFILTTIFVAYVIYALIEDQKTTATPKTAPIAKPEAQAVVAEQAKPQIAVAEQKTAAIKPAPAKTAAVKPAPTKAKAAKKAPVVAKSGGLKDPKTGEVATTYNNYRFTKRWIKEALVTEGLLEKVYTGSELNAEIEAKIKEAVAQLEAMDKYKA
jgi:hypothetical protein